jgi:predicted SAM-dependent methyltransferase
MKTLKEIIVHLRLKRPAVYLLSLCQKWRSHFKWSEIKSSECVWLELGSGAKKGTHGWITVDIYGADISWDLRKGIPLPNNCVDRIYTSHMLEHIPYKNLVSFIHECFRVLKVGGELSVCVPNAGLYIQAYVNSRQFRSSQDGYKPALVNTGSFLDQVNYIAYMDGQHHYMFDEENLINTLKKSPFSLVKLRQFDPGIDLESRDSESIYASAVK